MRTRTTQTLFQYWNRLRGTDSAPRRGNIEPADIRDVLASTIILEVPSKARDPLFRLAGTAISSMFGSELRGQPLRAIVPPLNTVLIHRLVRNCVVDHVAAIITYQGRTARGRTADIEMLLLPLQDEQGDGRVLGAVSVIEPQFWVGLEAMVPSALHSVRVVDPTREPLFLNNRPEIAVPAMAPDSDDLTANTRLRDFASGPQLRVIEGGLSQKQAGKDVF